MPHPAAQHSALHPPGSTPMRPRELIALARSGVSTPLMTEMLTAPFSSTSPPSNTEVMPYPPPPRSHLSCWNVRPLPSSASAPCRAGAAGGRAGAALDSVRGAQHPAALRLRDAP